MAKKLTEKALVKNLEIMSRVELVKIITELFKTNKVVEARLNLLFLGDAYHDAVIMASKDEELYQLWKDRLEYIYHEFSGFGWGMDDYITEEYYSIPWIEEDK